MFQLYQCFLPLNTLFLQEEQRVDKVHPLEAKRSCEAIQHALKTVEDNIRNMFSDVQALKNGHYHQAEQLYRRYVHLGQNLELYVKGRWQHLRQI